MDKNVVSGSMSFRKACRVSTFGFSSNDLECQLPVLGLKAIICQKIDPSCRVKVLISKRLNIV